jgi:precorrin-3B synthase
MPPTPDFEDRRPTAPEIRGWCPGAYAPMESNDGLLIRAKVIGSRLSAEQVMAIAAISMECGNGRVDLSQRAQLQIRGLTDATLAEALRRLDAAHLLARDAEAERVANIIASPLAGLGAHVEVDANAMAGDLAIALQGESAFAALPAKFLFAIDDGGGLPLSDVDRDISIEARDGAFVIRIAGCDHLAVPADRDGAVDIALKLARAFITLRNGDFELRRMKRLVACNGVEALLREAGLEALPDARRARAAPSAFLGAHDFGAIAFVGAAAPSGRWRAEELATIAAHAAEEGLGELRLTPWRAILVPTRGMREATRLADLLRPLGLIVAHDDPRLAVVACPGAPECPQARGDTRGALARFAPLAQKLAGGDGVGLHVSGCAKGCARPGDAPVTLIANDGRFDLVDCGRASDAPHMTGLDVAAVEGALTARAKEHPCPRL